MAEMSLVYTSPKLSTSIPVDNLVEIYTPWFETRLSRRNVANDMNLGRDEGREGVRDGWKE